MRLGNKNLYADLKPSRLSVRNYSLLDEVRKKEIVKMREVTIGIMLPHEIMAALFNFDDGRYFYQLIGLPTVPCQWCAWFDALCLA